MKWVREKQTQYDFIYFYDQKKKKTESEIQRTILVIARGEGAGRTGKRIVEGDEEVQTSSYKYLTWI